MSLLAAALKPRSILIATDFSEASEKALRYSLALARFYESKFCLAHVVSSLGLTMAGPAAIAACEEAVAREAADLEDSLIQTGALSGIQHKFIVRLGYQDPDAFNRDYLNARDTIHTLYEQHMESHPSTVRDSALQGRARV